ncbi:Hypothetical predicted protein [Cloeon dipterum]|uniref:Pentacotripeptide-repeat region of PRORP domain-containing protein n=1 Tax=Cloeon dipterum TaxID=197152 RepID=A0A8S1CS29_9INSE|nr:Hypothetical predicted protein [Cloeon dipterum]
MSSLLRSCKFVRFLAGITRNISYGNGKQDNFDWAVHHNPNVYRGLAIRALATQQVISIRQENTLDKSLRKIDQEARRAGRISKRELDEILDEIKQSRSATSSQSLMVIRFCGSMVPEEHPEVRTKLVQNIWNTLESLGVPMDISHYNALLRVYWENGHQFSPTEFLKQLEKKGIEPNRVTYQRLVAQHCQQGEMDGAARILQIMREKQMPINETVFNALITGHSQNGDMESARGILALMKQAGLEATADTFTALLCGHAKQGDIEAIRAVMADAESQNIEFMNKDILEVVFSLAQAGHQEHVDEMLGFKKSAGFVQDCINTILRLVNIGQEDVGRKLLNVIPLHVRQGPEGPETLPSGTFFVRQLVKAGRPTEKIISICEEMQKSGANPRALYVALETSLNEGNDSVSFELMQKLKEAGEPLRQHYFWPLFLRRQKDNNVKGLCEVLVAMQKLEVPIRGDTLREYVLNSIKADSLGKINLLRSCGVSVGTAAVSVIINLLEEGNLEEAANLAGQVKAQYPFENMKRFLGRAFGQSKNTESLIKMLQCIAASKKDSEDGDSRSNGLIGELLVDSINNLQGSKGETTLKVLKGLVDCGLSINVASAEKLQEMLGSELTAEISEALGQLTSGNLELQPLQLSDLNSTAKLSISSLEQMYETLSARNQPTKIIRKNLLIRYCRSGNLEKAENIKKSLDAENFVHSVGCLALMIELYANHGNIEEALSLKKIIAERDPDIKLDNLKLIRLATAQIKAGRPEDALATLKDTCETELDSQTAFKLRGACWEMLNLLAEQKDEQNLNAALDCIISNKIVPINNVLLGPLVKIKLLQDDIPGALEQFQWCCEQHRATPWKSELTRRLIDNEDAASLQKLTDLSTQVHGEVNSLYDLVFAFVECGRIRQARRILETPGLRARTFRMETACERYCESGKSSSLEGLLEATKELHHVDRSNIFLNLLKLYCKNDETDKALNLWTQAQEENYMPPDEFLVILSEQLKKHNIEIPFVVPERVEHAPPPPKTEKAEADRPAPPTRQPKKERVLVSVSKAESDFMELRQALRRNDVDNALEIKKRLNANGLTINVRDASYLIENLINTDRVGEAFKIAKEMAESNVFPLSRVFRYLLNKVAATGDIDGIAELGYAMDDEQKKIISYDNRLCNAYLFSNRAKEYLDLIDEKIKNSKSEEEISKLAEQFPRGSALGILNKHPELTGQLSEIAKKYAEKGHLAPYNVLWMHLFATGQYDEAKLIWEKYLSKSTRVMFQHICQEARKNNDAIMCSNLFGLLVSSETVTSGARGNVLSCLIDILSKCETVSNLNNLDKQILPSSSLQPLMKSIVKR